MIAKYVNPLIQFNYWCYDIIFVNEYDEILNRNTTFFYTEPTKQDYIDRVNQLNTIMEYNYDIIKIEIPF